MSKKEQLYYLINSYHQGGYDTATFCSAYYDVFYPDIPKDELSDFELNVFQKVASVVSRFSQYDEDFINCPNAYFNEGDVRKIAEEAYTNLMT